MGQYGKTLCRNDHGFSLIELIIYMALLGVLMTMVFSSFIPVMRTSSRQWRIAETKIETGSGLDLLRADLEHAGFGLPWEFQTTPNYTEAQNSLFNPGGDTLLLPMSDAPSGVPRALVSSDDLPTPISLNNSDYLTIKALNVMIGNTSQKWGWLGRKNDHTPSVQSLTDAFDNTEAIIVINPQVSPGQYRQLVMNGAAYFTTPNSADLGQFAPPPTPNDPNGVKHLIYGLKDNNVVRRPFNRTDYYINNANVPRQCAPGTGVLVKVTANQGDDNLGVPMPIVDCVADFQVVYHLDTNGDGGWDMRVDANDLAGLTAQQIRDQVKSIRCYFLTHEGGVDDTYTHPLNPVTGLPAINVGEVAANGITLLAGRAFDLNAAIGTTWANYRWKVYSLAVTPKNLQ